MSKREAHSSSFRDPSGHIFWQDGVLLRSVECTYAEHYDRLMASGLYRKLVEDRTLIPHEEVPLSDAPGNRLHRVLRPEPIPFVSYPWEWSYSQLRDAALLTLDLAWAALEHDMVLKDASAFNVQFIGSRPVFIDTLSFENYEEGQTWQAYRQFCQHFLAPLELQSRLDPSLSGLLRDNLDGIPLDLASHLLPRSSRLRPSTLLHIHAHARTQRKYADSRGPATHATISRRAFFALIDSLRSAVTKCKWKPPETEWADYYEDTNYSDDAMQSKSRVVERILAEAAPSSVWDLGANTGRFSRLASAQGAYTIAFDVDPVAVDRAYRRARADNNSRLLPLVLDLMNPSPNLGWALRERSSLVDRGHPDLTLALALVHHLAIGQNVPLDRIASFFAEFTNRLVIEFVPKSDSQVQRLLSSRKDIFPDYTSEGFLEAFSGWFEINDAQHLDDCDRVVYSMTSRKK